MGAWEEYNQRPWRLVANTIQSYSITSSQLTSIIEEESHTMHQRLRFQANHGRKSNKDKIREFVTIKYLK